MRRARGRLRPRRDSNVRGGFSCAETRPEKIQGQRRFARAGDANLRRRRLRIAPFGRARQPENAGGRFGFTARPPDPIIHDQIDLGALAAEFLALNLDLYPRKPGVTLGNMYVGGEVSGTGSPFAGLRHRS